MKSFSLDFPLSRTHCGIAMGNGNFGALVWGVDKLHVTVNRSDFWDHRGGELIVPGTTYEKLLDTAAKSGTGDALEKSIPRYEFPADVFKPQRLPVGRFEFALKEGVKPRKGTLDYASGTVTVELSNGAAVKFDMSLTENVLLIRDETNAIVATEVKPSWEFPKSKEWLEKYGFVPPERLSEKGAEGWAIKCPADPSLACVCAKREGGLAVALELGEDNAKAFAKAKESLAKFDAAKTVKENASWWKSYWRSAPEIKMGEKFYDIFFQYALYKFACATHPNGYPCGLQGPWHEEYKRAEWSGDYHFNVNVQQVYSLAFATGKLEHLLPLFDMIESAPFQDALKRNAKTMFGIDDGLWFTHAVDDRGWQCGWLITGSILDPACGAWTAKLYWDYYKHSCDKKFLKERALPFIKGIMRGYEAMLRERDGELEIPLAVSAEYGSSNSVLGAQHVGRNPSYQLAATHFLADALIEASETLGLEVKPVWLDVKKRLPKFSVFSGAESYSAKPEKRIAIWDGLDLEVCHRHHSHLGCIYPFDSLPEELSDEEKEIVDNSLDHWIMKGFGQWSEWCMPWAAIIYSRSGFQEAPGLLLGLWKEIFVNESFATVYLPRSRGVIAHRRHDISKPKESNEFIQLDGTMAGATAFLEMLVHQKGKTVRLFQGIPSKLADVSFKRVRLPGGFIASASRKNGKIEKLEIKSKFGGSLKIELDGKAQIFEFAKGETKRLV